MAARAGWDVVLVLHERPVHLGAADGAGGLPPQPAAEAGAVEVVPAVGGDAGPGLVGVEADGAAVVEVHRFSRPSRGLISGLGRGRKHGHADSHQGREERERVVDTELLLPVAVLGPPLDGPVPCGRASSAPPATRPVPPAIWEARHPQVVPAARIRQEEKHAGPQHRGSGVGGGHRGTEGPGGGDGEEGEVDAEEGRIPRGAESADLALRQARHRLALWLPPRLKKEKIHRKKRSMEGLYDAVAPLGPAERLHLRGVDRARLTPWTMAASPGRGGAGFCALPDAGVVLAWAVYWDGSAPGGSGALRRRGGGGPCGGRWTPSEPGPPSGRRHAGMIGDSLELEAPVDLEDLRAAEQQLLEAVLVHRGEQGVYLSATRVAAGRRPWPPSCVRASCHSSRRAALGRERRTSFVFCGRQKSRAVAGRGSFGYSHGEAGGVEDGGAGHEPGRDACRVGCPPRPGAHGPRRVGNRMMGRHRGWWESVRRSRRNRGRDQQGHRDQNTGAHFFFLAEEEKYVAHGVPDMVHRRRVAARGALRVARRVYGYLYPAFVFCFYHGRPPHPRTAPPRTAPPRTTAPPADGSTPAPAPPAPPPPMTTRTALSSSTSAVPSSNDHRSIVAKLLAARSTDRVGGRPPGQDLDPAEVGEGRGAVADLLLGLLVVGAEGDAVAGEDVVAGEAVESKTSTDRLLAVGEEEGRGLELDGVLVLVDPAPEEGGVAAEVQLAMR